MTARNLLPLSVALVLIGLSFVACGPWPGSDDAADPTRSATAPDEASAEATAPAADEGADEASTKWGPPLKHPEHYYGLYSNADAPNRVWFVKKAERPMWAERAPEIPPGHLAVGAMFGDVAPWNMKTLSDTEFEQAEVSDAQPEPVSVEFDLGDDGRAFAFSFTNKTSASEGPLVRQGDLPEEWRHTP